MRTLLTLLAIPILILNWLGGIIGGIWLIILGDWFTFVAGLAVGFGGLFAIGLLMMPGMLFLAPAALFFERGKQALGTALGSLGLVWTYLVMTVWCVGIFAFLLNRSGTESIWPYVLWAYGAASGPWVFVAQKEARSDANSYAPMTAFAVQLGCISMMVAAMLDTYDLSVARLAAFFLPFMAVSLLLQGFLVFATMRAPRNH